MEPPTSRESPSRIEPIRDGSWSELVNLGPAINTGRTEYGPFLASDGVTLYFGSNGHGGYGRRDLFFSRRLDSTWTNWSAPRNLGPTINTPGDETDYTISASGEEAFFAAVLDPSRGSDLFRIALPKLSRDTSSPRKSASIACCFAAMVDPVLIFSECPLPEQRSSPLRSSFHRVFIE